MRDAGDTPTVRLQVCVNGARAADDHPALPVRPRAVADDLLRCLRVGADAVHVHPRGEDGTESLDAADVARTLLAIRRVAPDVEISVSTGAWIEPDPVRRLGHIRRWEHLPDVASVNLSEVGAVETAEVLLDRGVGVEAGLWSVGDVDRLAVSGLAGRCRRLLVEAVGGESPEDAAALVTTVLEALDGVEATGDRLVHGAGRSTWAVLSLAGRLGLATRIGLEDTRRLPDGRQADSNAALVAAACRLL
ncbi:MAG: 3-keto-5-aminohexanoate cleavage protein [Actinomycetota bacterium]